MSILRRTTVITRASWTVIAVLVAVCGCRTNGSDRSVPLFDHDRAFRDLVRQTEFGPRVPGTTPHAECAAWLIAQLGQTSDSVWTEQFTQFVPLVSDTLTFTNIVARFGASEKSRILLGAHWDTRPYADMDPDPARRSESFDGANDGASGVAVLLELARQFAEDPPSVGVDIVLFDAEDLGRSGYDAEWCLGSTYFSMNNDMSYRFGVIVDLVGEAGLELRREGYSYTFAKPLQDRIWRIAADMGQTAFVDELEEFIQDDHVPLLLKGVPTVDLIDIRYPYWHTSGDTVDKCSAASLGAVGQVLLQLVYSS